MNKSLPKVSVIIATFNAESVISDALDSILYQSFVDWECIIVDGASKDNTVSIIHNYMRYDNRIRFISEPDAGIYDAFNKGCNMACGEWIYYLGADDILLPGAFTSIFSFDLGESGIIFGDVVYKTPLGLIHKCSNSCIDSIKKRLNCSHQGFLMRKDLIKRMGGFDFKTYRICADYDLILRSYLYGAPIKYIPVEVAIFDTSGFSGSCKMEIECFMVRRNNKSVSMYMNCILWIYNTVLFYLRRIGYKVQKIKDIVNKFIYRSGIYM